MNLIGKINWKNYRKLGKFFSTVESIAAPIFQGLRGKKKIYKIYKQKFTKYINKNLQNI